MREWAQRHYDTAQMMQKAPMSLPVLLDLSREWELYLPNKPFHLLKKRPWGLHLQSAHICSGSRTITGRLKTTGQLDQKTKAPQTSNEKLVYVALGGYLSPARGTHAAQRFPDKQERPRHQLFAQQQDSTYSYKYLLCASSFEAHEASVPDGAAASQRVQKNFTLR